MTTRIKLAELPVVLSELKNSAGRVGAQWFSRIEADGAANSQIIHNVEEAFSAFELGNLRLVGSELGRQVPLGHARRFAVALERGDDGVVFARICRDWPMSTSASS